MDKLSDNNSAILKNIQVDQDEKRWWETNSRIREKAGIPPMAPSQSEERRKKEMRKILHGIDQQWIRQRNKNQVLYGQQKEPVPRNEGKIHG